MRCNIKRILAALGIAPKTPAAIPEEPPLTASGRCPVCETQVQFVASGPWLRDEFICMNCKCVPRERALIATLNLYFPDWRHLKIHESSPALRSSAKLRRDCPDYTATNFDADTPRGELIKRVGVRNEDLERQTFADDSFDLVITQDVFEHLFRPDLAIAEIGRTLKPGGAHICTVPIGRKNLPSIWRAKRTETGTIDYLMEAVYHGNPIDDAGSLVTVDYGYDIADYFDAHSGLNTTIVYMNDLSQGIRAEFIEVLVSRKASGLLPLDAAGS